VTAQFHAPRVAAAAWAMTAGMAMRQQETGWQSFEKILGGRVAFDRLAKDTLDGTEQSAKCPNSHLSHRQ